MNDKVLKHKLILLKIKNLNYDNKRRNQKQASIYTDDASTPNGVMVVQIVTI